jgi:hypothetical protein
MSIKTSGQRENVEEAVAEGQMNLDQTKMTAAEKHRRALMVLMIIFTIVMVEDAGSSKWWAGSRSDDSGMWL